MKTIVRQANSSILVWLIQALAHNIGAKQTLTSRLYRNNSPGSLDQLLSDNLFLAEEGRKLNLCPCQEKHFISRRLWMVLSFRCCCTIGHLLYSGHGVSHVCLRCVPLWDGMGRGMLEFMAAKAGEQPATFAWTELCTTCTCMSVRFSCCLPRINGVLLTPIGV